MKKVVLLLGLGVLISGTAGPLPFMGIIQYDPQPTCQPMPGVILTDYIDFGPLRIYLYRPRLFPNNGILKQCWIKGSGMGFTKPCLWMWIDDYRLACPN